MQDQVKYLEQKYSGAQHPFGYNEPSIEPNKDHTVPITNYLNAQCMLRPPPISPSACLALLT